LNIFTTYDYRKILDSVISERKNLDSSINFQQMAAFIRVPKSYISRVIHGKANLNSDQMFLVCQFLGFSDPQSGYMQLILEYARAGLKTRKDKILIEIRKVQGQHLDTKEHLKATQVRTQADSLTSYYLDPMIQITHICLSIPRYQKDLNLLAQDLKISRTRLLDIVNKLEQLQLITRDKHDVKLLVENMHLPKQSEVYRPWRNQLKLMTMQKINAMDDEKAYSFSVVFSANEDIKKEIQAKFFAYLKEIEALVSNGPQEHAYQLSFDLFPWTVS
jgi:uncharacterized protein (TIGR02147 family)